MSTKRSFGWAALLVSTSLVAPGWPALAQTVTPVAVTPVLQPPTDPVAKAAYDVLERHCARCHQADRLTNRVKPAKNFGNVLAVQELAKNPSMVLPGNPDGSLLFNQIAKREMPYDLYYELDSAVPTPTAEDLQALRTWIEKLGSSTAEACQARKFVSNNDVVATIATDLQALPPHRVKGTRYLTFTHLYNACADEKEVEGYRQGAVKLLNSLGRSSDVVRLETIDPAKAIVRFNIEDLGWSEDNWTSILAAYPYKTKPDTRLFAFLQQATNTPLPYVRADWFGFTAAQPPLYTSLLGLPPTAQELEKQVDLNIADNIKKFVAQRAGFQNSGVSQHNRMIERHPIKNGYFWTSYDFSGSRGNQSLYEFPLGPGADEASFHHDGGETIYSLPNGFQGYYLSTAAGLALTKGPTQIVRDMSRKDLAVTNGISCMGCHDQGIRKKADDIRDHVLSDRTFSKATREAVDALYPPKERMDAILEDDTRRFRSAMERAGLDPSLKVNGVETINALGAKYEATVDLKLAAAEFGLTVDGLKDATRSTPAAFGLVRRLEQGLVPRDQFEIEFARFAPSLTDEEILKVDAPASAAVAGTDATGSTKPKLSVAKPNGDDKDATRRFDVALTSDKTAYKMGERAVFTVVAKETCNLTLINVDTSGKGTIIFPNKSQKDNRITADKPFEFGGDASPFEFRLPDKGTETVVADCNASRVATRGLEADNKAGGFTDLGNFAQSLSRSIVVQAKAAQEAKLAAPKPASGTAPKSTSPAQPDVTKVAQSDIAGRTAIKIKVE